MRFLYLFLFCILFLVGCNQQTVESTEILSNNNLLDSLLGDAKEQCAFGNYDKSEAILDGMPQYFTIKTDSSRLLLWLNNKTELLKIRGQYDAAILNYYRIETLAKSLNDTLCLAMSYYNLSTVYNSINQLDNCEMYLNESLLSFKQIGRLDREMDVLVMYAIISRKKGDINKAKNQLQQVITYYEEENYLDKLPLCYNNYGNILTDEGNIVEALDYYFKSLSIRKEQNNMFSMALCYGNIGGRYLEMDLAKLGHAYIDSSMRIAKTHDYHETVKNNLLRLTAYYEDKNPAKGMKYLNELYELDVEALNLQSEEVIREMEKKQALELDLILSEQNNQLLEREGVIREKSHANRQLLATSIIILIFLIAFIVFILYQRQRKFRAYEKRIHQIEKKQLDHEKQQVERELVNNENEKNIIQNELVFFSLKMREYIIQISSIRKQFIEIDQTEMSHLPSYKKLRKNQFALSQQISNEIHERIDEHSQMFYLNLKMREINLSETELRMAVLIVSGMSSKEISDILTIETKSVEMKRYRLRKKLNLDREVDLIDALKRLGSKM